LDIDTTGGRPTLVRGSARISNLKPVGDTIVTGYYYRSYDTSDITDTLTVERLTFSPQLTQVSGLLRGIRRSVTPPDTVTFEFESIIPRTYR
jgi:hypothetical protein